MGVGLVPLEFTECLTDSPHFRENLLRHEKELDRTSQQVKRLVKEVKDVVHAAKRLGAAQLALAGSMEQFEFACIGASMTEDERVISHSLHHFARLMRTIEDERERMLGRAHEQIIAPLEKFRKEHIGAVKEGKKKFDKKTAKFCQSQERTLSLSTKKQENVFQEADAAMDMAERDFCQASLEYVFQLQAVREREKFELVETLLGFVFSWWTFHHTAHDVHHDAEPLVRDLQLRIQRTRTNFEETSKQTESLMKKMMEVRQLNKEVEAEEAGEAGEAGEAAGGGVSRAGYLYLMEKKAFGTAWSKHYCTYEKTSRTLRLLPYSQINPKTTAPPENVCVCGARRAADSERRFCWEALPADRERPALTLQALSERDRTAWLRALSSQNGGVELGEGVARGAGACEAGGALDDAGFAFVRRIIAVLEERGLEEQGLYRVAGVASKVSRLVACARDARLPASLADPLEWESKTLTSALKAYLRALPEPLATHALHARFIAAAKLESRLERVAAVSALVATLPPRHRDMLQLVVQHLRRVAARADRNLMTPSNLAVCFGPTLLRAPRESVAAILDLKFYNVLVETLLEHAERVFAPQPDASPPPPPPPPAHNGRGASPAPLSSALLRAADCSTSVPALAHVAPGAGGGAGLPPGARYSPQHQQLLQHFAPPAPEPPALRALRGAGRSSSSSAESVSSCSASPPPPGALPLLPPHTHTHTHAHAHTHAALAPLHARLYTHPYRRVRTLYACLGESEGELSFEPNQIITNVAPSAEPGWLRGTLNGKSGLVPENYVEPLP